MKTLMGLVLLASLHAVAAPRYCQSEPAVFGAFEGKIAPVTIRGRCVVPEAQGLSLDELRALIRRNVGREAKVLEGPTPIEENGLRGERFIFEYVESANKDQVPGHYEFVIVDDGVRVARGRLRSIELRGQGLIGYLKSYNVVIDGALGPTAELTATIETRALKPTWAGTPKLFQDAIGKFLPGLLDGALRDIENQIEAVR